MTTASPTWESIVDKAVDSVIDGSGTMANKAGEALSTASTAIQSMIDAYGPQTVDAMLWVIRINNIQNLIQGLVILLMLVIVWYITVRVFFYHYRMIPGKMTDSGQGFNSLEHKNNFTGAYGLCMFLGVLVTIVILVCSSTRSIVNVWTYVGVAKPELWIAKQVVDRVDEKLSARK